MTKKPVRVAKVCRCVKTRPHDAALHDVQCMPRGPDDAEVMVVGMWPGMDEALRGKYFVGASGKQLDRDLLTAGISPKSVRFQNLAQYWPRHHSRGNLTQEQLESGLAALVADIQEIQPKVIIVLGNEPLEALTGKTGITKWRGSLLESKPELGLPPAPILPTLHPSALLREWDYHSLILSDLGKARRLASGDPTVYPKQRKLVTKDDPEYQQVFEEIMRAAQDSSCLMACDIEVFQGALSCLGVSVQSEVGLSVWHEDRDMWRALLDTPSKKIWHNGMYDLTFLEAREGVVPNGEQHDTQFLWHALYPALACSKAVGKRLSVLTSLFTSDNYYKDTLENWRKIADWDAFFRYNARDACVTLEIAEQLFKKVQADEALWRVYNFERSLLKPFIRATMRGIRIDTKAKGIKAAVTKKRMTKLNEELLELAGEELNIRSWQQLLKLYKQNGVPLETTDKKALTDVLLTYDQDTWAHKFTTALLEYKQLHKAYSTYYTFEHDDDGRLRTNWIIPGTETGRMANSKSIIFKGGANVMTIPRAAREFFIADDGYVLCYADLSQAEARIVAYLAGCEKMIAAFDSADAYKLIASWMFNKDVSEITYDERYLAKRCVLGLLYGMGIKHWRTLINVDKGYDYISYKETAALFDLFFETFPEIKAYHRAVEVEMRKSRQLKTLILGRRRLFRPRWGEFGDALYREGYDYVPQGTVPEIVNTAVLTLDNYDPAIMLIGQVHDAWFGQVRDDADLMDHLRIVKQALYMPLKIRGVDGKVRTCTIPTEIQIGKNWGDYDEETNPNGLKKVDV